MIPQVRFYFMIFLVLLQLVAPLIHAHKNEQFSIGSSFHLPEFEQVNVFLEHRSAMITPSFHEGEMVTVSSGVKENQRRFLSVHYLAIFISFCFLIIFIFQQTAQRFFIQTEPIKRCRFFNLVSSRAPPVFIL